MRSSVRLALLSFILFGIVDSILTYVGIAFFGLTEVNLFMRRLIDMGWPVFFIFKTSLYAMLACIAIEIDKTGLANYGLSMLGFTVVLWNILMLTSVVI